MKKSSCSPLPSSTAVSSAPTLPRSAESVFLKMQPMCFSAARAERARTCRYAVSGVSCLVGTHSTSTLAPVSVSSIFGRRDTFVFRPASENFTPASSAPVTSSARTRTFIIVCGALPFSFLGYTVPGWLLCPNYIGTSRPLESRRAPFCVLFLNNIFLCRFILPPDAKFPLCFLSFMHKIMLRHRSGLAVLNGCLKINHLRYDPFCFILELRPRNSDTRRAWK